MGFWNLYFITKIYLASVGRLAPVWWLNLLFALGLIVPLKQRWQRVLRLVVALMVGAVLMYRESALPPFAYVLRQMPGLASFSPTYMMELARRVFTPALIYIPLLAVVVYAVANRWLRVTTFVFLGLIIMPVWQGIDTLIEKSVARSSIAAQAQNDARLANAGGPASSENFDEQLAEFHQGEKDRRVDFVAMSKDQAVQFDIIVIHICSLSWDDLDVDNMSDSPLFSRFDYIFKNFSSAASYSGPAAIRLLRASCGQEPHQALYGADPQDCHLFADLAAAGYDVQFMMNHDGHFDNFRGIVEREIGRDGIQPQSIEGLPAVMKEFDGSPLVGDYDALAKWYQGRIDKGGGPVALYYNTVTLHDGNRLPNSNLTSVQSHPIRLKKLMGDIDRLIELIAHSGRKAVVVFVPEHGAALRGDAKQISGLREIPTPRIINVPVGVRLIGLPSGEQRQGPATIIDRPTSYLALAQLLSGLVANSPYRADAPPLARYANDLPQTRMVGENENTVTLNTLNGYVVHTPDGVWIEGK